MPEIKPDPKRRRTCNRLPPAQWAEIRLGYESGETASALAERFGACRSVIYHHARKEDWSRAPTRPSPVKLPRTPRIDALTIAEAALAAAITALRQGRSADAMSLIKAGDAIGAFADFVTRLRANDDAAEPA